MRLLVFLLIFSLKASGQSPITGKWSALGVKYVRLENGYIDSIYAPLVVPEIQAKIIDSSKFMSLDFEFLPSGIFREYINYSIVLEGKFVLNKKKQLLELIFSGADAVLHHEFLKYKFSKGKLTLSYHPDKTGLNFLDLEKKRY